MKKMSSQTRTAGLLICLILISAIDAGAAIRIMKMSEAVTKKIVSVDGINTLGRYTGYALKLTAKTLKKEKDTIELLVDVGMIMKPDDTSCQPMILAGGDTMMLTPGERVQTHVAIFCGDAPRHCPKKSLHYSYYKVGSDALVKVLQFINKHKLYDHLGQSAVWVITNDHSVGNVYDRSEDKLSKQLINELCRITGAEYPNYFALHETKEIEGTAAFVPKTVGLIAEFKPKLTAATILSVEVFNKQGMPLDKLIERQLFYPGPRPISVMFDPRPYGPGEYVLKLISAEGTLEEKVVKAQL